MNILSDKFVIHSLRNAVYSTNLIYRLLHDNESLSNVHRKITTCGFDLRTESKKEELIKLCNIEYLKCRCSSEINNKIFFFSEI